MTLKEFKEKCQGLKFEEERSFSDDYGEFVIAASEIEQWYKKFEEIFGQPKNKQGAQPAKEDLALSHDYGGIRANQVLYKRDFEKGSVLAMFWPWGDGSLITLKVIIKS